jgi:hypothetical protein
MRHYSLRKDILRMPILKVEIDGDNAAFGTIADFADLVEKVARRLRDGETSHGIYDSNGNYVGQFYITGVESFSDSFSLEN